MSINPDTSIDPAADVLLSWTDGESFLGGDVVRPPKKVWLEERGVGSGAPRFEIEQLFGNLLRRGLSHLGGMTSREVETVPAQVVGTEEARSVKPWSLPTPSGMRLRAVYRFRNGRGAVSSKLISHRFARVETKAGGGAKADLSLIGAPIGVNGKGEIGGAVQFAVDPVARVSVVSAGGEGAESIRDFVRASYEEMAELERGAPGRGGHPDIDPERATLAFGELFSDFLTDEAPRRWRFPEAEPIEGDEGATVEFELPVEADEPGRSLLAIRVEDVEHPERVAFSDIFALEVTEQLEIRLLSGPAIGAERIVYERGTLSTAALQREIDLMWSSLEEDPELAAAVKASRIERPDRSEECPIRVLEEVAGIDPGSILLVIAGTVGSDLWREVLLPRIRQRFGEGAVEREQRRD